MPTTKTEKSTADSTLSKAKKAAPATKPLTAAIKKVAAKTANPEAATSAKEQPVEATTPTATAAVVPAVPKIKTITVQFTQAIKDLNKRIIPIGPLTAVYDNGTKLIIEKVTGGSSAATYGMSDAVKNVAIFRVEKSTYKNHLGQPMPYALFYNGGEALHVGRIDLTSHGCVHVPDAVKMKKLNADVIKNKTAVTVKYDAGIFEKVKNKTL